MYRVLIIAWRDFKQTVMRKVFLLAILGIPLGMIGLIAVAAIIMVGHEEPPLVGTVAVVTQDADAAEAVREAFTEEEIERDRAEEMKKLEEAAGPMSDMPGGAGMTGGMGPGSGGIPFQRGDVIIDIEHLTEADTSSLQQRVRSGDLLGAAIIAPNVLDAPPPDTARSDMPRLKLFVREGLDSDNVELIERRLGEAVVRVRAQRADLEPDAVLALLTRPRSETSRLLESGGIKEESELAREMKQLIPMAFMMLIWIATFTAGQHLMMSTIEEKSNRVMEVLLSAVSPLQLMSGKILGMGAVGLLIMLVYSSLGIVSLIAFAASDYLDAGQLVLLFLYFFMAYFMIASLMAAVGSAVSDIREANTLVTPVMLILFVPLMLWMPITQDPNGAIATAFSFIPPAIPFAMILRSAADEAVPAWQIPATLIWGYACTLGMVWLAAKIFRVGVLMYGKPPSPLEMLRWIRYS